MLLEHADPQALSLNELARRAGMAKSNVYRYFESREAVLLALLSQEWEHWYRHVNSALSAKRGERVELQTICRLFATAVVAQPLLGPLSCILPSIIENNVAPETLRRFKLASLQTIGELAKYFHERAPLLSGAQYEELIHNAVTLLVGLWPFSHPSAAVAELLQAPELRPFRHDFVEDFARGLLVFAKGLESEQRL
jgi:AcrR family transcriptional regulator